MLGKHPCMKFTLRCGAKRVDGADVPGQRADGYPVHPGFGDCPHPLQVYASRGFELRAPLAILTASAISSRLMLSSRIMPAPASSASSSWARDSTSISMKTLDGAMRRASSMTWAMLPAAMMCFPDQDAVVEADTVVDSAARQHRVLLCQTQAGQGLAGVDNAGFGAGDRIDIASRHRRGAGQKLEEIERRALGGQQGPRAGDHVAQHLAGFDPIAILGVPQYGARGFHRREGRLEPGGAAQDGGFAGDHPPARIDISGDQLGGEVASTDVFGQRCRDAALDLDPELFTDLHAGSVVECPAHSNTR